MDPLVGPNQQLDPTAYARSIALCVLLFFGGIQLFLTYIWRPSSGLFVGWLRLQFGVADATQEWAGGELYNSFMRYYSPLSKVLRLTMLYAAFRMSRPSFTTADESYLLLAFASTFSNFVLVEMQLLLKGTTLILGVAPTLPAALGQCFMFGFGVSVGKRALANYLLFMHLGNLAMFVCAFGAARRAHRDKCEASTLHFLIAHLPATLVGCSFTDVDVLSYLRPRP